MWIRMQIYWRTMTLTLKNSKKLFLFFLSFTLQQISTKDYDIVKSALTFCFNNQCQTVSEQQLIFLKFKTKIKSESMIKRVCKSVGLRFVKSDRISIGFEI